MFLEKMRRFFSIFPVILVSKPMRMAKTDFPAIYIYTYIGQCWFPWYGIPTLCIAACRARTVCPYWSTDDSLAALKACPYFRSSWSARCTGWWRPILGDLLYWRSGTGIGRCSICITGKKSRFRWRNPCVYGAGYALILGHLLKTGKVRFLEDASSAKLITSFSLSLYSVMTFIIATDGGTEQKLGVQKKTLLDFW